MTSPHPSPQYDQLPGDVLAHPRRRQLLRILSAADAPMALADLAADIAAHEQPPTDGQPDWDLIERIYITLYHRHIPKLDDCELVEFSMAQRTVALTDSLSPTTRTKLRA